MELFPHSHGYGEKKLLNLNPELSVIVPVLNEAAILPELFRTLAEQQETELASGVLFGVALSVGVANRVVGDRLRHVEGVEAGLRQPKGEVEILWPEGVETEIGDITDRVAVRTAMQGIDAVIHLAALLHIVNPPPSLQPEYERINVGGTAAVVDAAQRARDSMGPAS